MRCGLDLGCYVASSFWGLIGLVPWWVCVLLAIAGLGAAYRFGGWPAVAALCFGYGVFWGARRPPRSKEPHKHVSGRDADPAPRKPRGARRYNPNTNSWE